MDTEKEKKIIETIVKYLRRKLQIESALKDLEITVDDRYEDGLFELVLDILDVPEDNTTSEKHSKCWEAMSFCKDCFCRDMFYEILDNFINGDFSYDEFVKRIRINLNSRVLENA